MIFRLASSALLLSLLAPILGAQDCKVKFAVAYAEGKAMQVGLTEEQKKFWDHDGPRKFKGMCLDPGKPDALIVWSEGVSGAEITASNVDSFNRARQTGQRANVNAVNVQGNIKVQSHDSRWTYETAYIRPCSAVRAKADYWVLDTSDSAKNPFPVLRKGEGFRDLPSKLAHSNDFTDKMKTTDMALTIADPTVALENALKWLKKEKKL